MITIVKKEGQQLVKIDKVEKGCWMNIYPPFSKENLEHLAVEQDIPIDFLTDSLDRDERSRYETDGETDLVVLNIPFINNGTLEDESSYLSIPIGIISKPDFIITISTYENKIINDFLSNKIKAFDPADQSGFTLKMFDRSVYYFLYFLRSINKQRYLFEKEIYRSSRNKELKQVLDLQKSLVYFVTNLRSNELMMNKIRRTNFLKISGDEVKEDYLEDIIIDNSQASEMADIYTNILNGTMDAFASIISNNLGRTVQRLTAVTIVLMVPTLIASFYGMNVDLPFQHWSGAFIAIMTVSLLFSGVMGYYFIKKRWF